MIRPAERTDLPELKILAALAWQNAYRGILSEQEIRENNEHFYIQEIHDLILERCDEGKHLFYVLIQGGLLMGMVDFDFSADETWLTRFYVHPDIIGQGFGTELLSHAEEELIRLGRTTYYLVVQEQNTLGLRYYEHKGFERYPRYDRPGGEICFRRKLAGAARLKGSG